MILIALTIAVAVITIAALNNLENYPAKVADKYEQLNALSLEYDNATTDEQREEIKTRRKILVYGSIKKANKALK